MWVYLVFFWPVQCQVNVTGWDANRMFSCYEKKVHGKTLASKGAVHNNYSLWVDVVLSKQSVRPTSFFVV